MSNFTFLTQEQCFENDKLDIFKKRGSAAAITDFSILLGGYVSIFYMDGKESLENRTGFYWTKTNDREYNVFVNWCGSKHWSTVLNRDGCGRISLPFSDIESIPTNGKKGERAEDGILEVEYGYYPQKAAPKDMQLKLEQIFKSGKLVRTGNGYTTDLRKYNELGERFEINRYDEYQYCGKRYVRVESYPRFEEKEIQLSNEEKYKIGDYVWVEVSPVKWLVDEKAKIMITEKLIFSGIQFNNTNYYHTEDFDKTDIKAFLDVFFSKELEQSRDAIGIDEKMLEETQTRRTRLQKLNPDKTKQSERTNMTDTEIIHNWIESGESVLLRGPSGIGKTERIKSLYPDLIYLKLTNNMFPEKVVGSTNLQTGQSIPPDFAKTIIMKEATEEERKLIKENIQNIYDIANTVYEKSKGSDKKIVLMLDEILNVKPAVQSLVYTLVLNRMVEINGGLKLPDNVVVVATRKSKKIFDSSRRFSRTIRKEI